MNISNPSISLKDLQLLLCKGMLLNSDVGEISSVTNKFASKCATIWPKCAQKCATEEFGQNVLKNAPQKFFYCIFMHQFF